MSGRPRLEPPIAKQIPKELTLHGETRIDPYFWLRDRSDPDVMAYLEAENAYTAGMMRPTEELQHTLYKEILGRIKEDDSSVPLKRDDFYYYTRTEKDRAYQIFCRKQGYLQAPEEVLLDTNLLAEGQKYFRIGNFAISPNHRLLAYSADLDGDEAYTIRIKELAGGRLLADEIPNTYYTLAWANDNRTFFYTVLDNTRRPYRVFRHELGGGTDELVYEELDVRFSLGLDKSRSDRYIFIHLGSPLTTEVRYIPADEPRAIFQPVFAREQGIEYSVEHQGPYFYVRTNEGAQNFRLMRTLTSDPSKQHWEEVIPWREDTTIEGVDGFRDYLVVYERRRGLEQIRIARSGDLTRFDEVEFPDPVYTAGPGGNAEYDTQLLRFVYASLVTPPSVFDYHIETRRRELKKQQEVLGGYDPSQYQSERIYARAPDNVEVPISLVYRKGMERNGRNPMLLDGYGSYGMSNDPDFASHRLSLLDRGFIFAIAHIRGGGDLGKSWHDAGKLMSKKNTFTDFIACAEHLINEGYTSSGRLAIHGGSAGGLLVGAVLNMRPELFHIVYTRVPFVDALSTMLDPTLPLTTSEYEEWGNPETREFYEYIRSYSPYDNVEPKPYPAMLVTSGINDPRVAYWEPAKWVAKLRAVKTDDRPVLLKMNMGSGHFGPSGRYDAIREMAFDYAFLLYYGGYLD